MAYGNVGGANRLNARSGRAGNNALLRNNGSIVEMKTADSMRNGSNIKIELEEIESGDQAYPSTCGFLTLLAELLRWGVDLTKRLGFRKLTLVCQMLSPV